MNKNQQDMMLHALGNKLSNSYRNYYCVCVGTPDESEWMELCQSGLAEKGKVINNGKDRYFFVTDKGIKELRQEKKCK